MVEAAHGESWISWFIASGVEGTALLIDCRSLSLEPVPLPSGAVVVVMDTRTPRGKFGLQRAPGRVRGRRRNGWAWPFCETRAARRPGAAERPLAPLLKRAQRVITENERTLLAAAAMRAHDAAELGRLMDASHDSLRHDYEVTSATLDTMVACARQQKGCRGAHYDRGRFRRRLPQCKRRTSRHFCRRLSGHERETGLTPIFLPVARRPEPDWSGFGRRTPRHEAISSVIPQRPVAAAVANLCACSRPMRGRAHPADGSCSDAIPDDRGHIPAANCYLYRRRPPPPAPQPTLPTARATGCAA